jgi:transposase-like protein
MIGSTAQRLMELEVEALTGVAHGERSPERLTHRNGYRDRLWETRAGTVEVRIPKLRKGRLSAPIPSEWPTVAMNSPAITNEIDSPAASAAGPNLCF